MPPAGFEPTIPAIKRPQTNTLDRAATGIGIILLTVKLNFFLKDGVRKIYENLVPKDQISLKCDVDCQFTFQSAKLYPST
jgi:hypothetical protein